MQRQTTIANAKTVTRKWYVIDATNLPLGRLASEIARHLTGTNKAIYTPNVDCGDYVIVINAGKVSLSGDAEHKKTYYNASGWARGIRSRTAGVMKREFPVEMIERAVHGMCPKGRLGRQIEKKLFVYAGSEHKHQAQNPEVLTLKY
jgi:large subunit ribosomal protein L13